MDIWGIVIVIIGAAGYLFSKRKPGWLFIAGVGVGILIGAVWHYALVTEAGDSFIFTGRP